MMLKAPTYSLNCRGQLLSLDVPKVMGILNATPDSFFAGSRRQTETEIALRVQQILEEGGDIIDVGAYSTRPGATEVTAEEEWERLVMALNIVRRETDTALLSIDSFRADIAKRCVEEFGVSIINDISGGDADAQMFDTVAQLRVPYVLMHCQGTPQTMQQAPHYNNVTAEVITDLSRKVRQLRERGVTDIIIDPGFGFGKTLEHNYTLLRQLEDFQIFNLPLLVGISRKSMITRLLGITADEALNGTTALHAFSLMKGANILRVHDVKEAVQVVKLYSYNFNLYG
ncbi:MAG: dihydropteroate synthase [Bacteroidaceae bacterium]|nr:dihydropteroate synthase [Bacteroidaceae bacterium]